MDIEDSWVSQFLASIKAKMRGGSGSWVITRVYGPNDVHLLNNFLEELDKDQTTWGGAWCITRDFNEVLPGERNKEMRLTRGMQIFSNFIENRGL